VSDPILGLTMLALIVAAIMMGFPTAFTLMGLGMLFGYLAFWSPEHHWLHNQVFDLMVQRTYGAMNNDTLLSIPLFVLMGYIIERAALVDKMFYAVQLAFRRLPASLAVTTLLVCAFWGIASGIVGAVVVLMGVIAMRPMLNAGYDVRLASGAITAGGTLGILIPPSVMLIVYAAVAGQSIVKLYAAAMLPGFFLTMLYLVYIIGWAIINPKVAPRLREDQYRVETPPWIARLERGETRRVFGGLAVSLVRPRGLLGVPGPGGRPVTYGLLAKNMLAALVPLATAVVLFGGVYWYIVIYNAPQDQVAPPPNSIESPVEEEPSALPTPPAAEEPPEEVEELGTPDDTAPPTETAPEPSPARPAQAPSPQGAEGPQELGGGEIVLPSDVGKLPEDFHEWFWGLAALTALVLLIYYRRMDGAQLEILKMLLVAVVPLAVLTFVVLAVILFGITTATESAGVGALGALYLASYPKYPRATLWASLAGAMIGAGLGTMRGDVLTIVISGALGALFVGTALPWLWDLAGARRLAATLTQSVYLTSRTTAMVCWLFVGSALFSAVFALHGGQSVIEQFVLSLNLSPIEFMILAQLIIFLLGWPLEWTEIIVIFVPIFIPMLATFGVDPVLFGTMVAVNLQAAFLSPPVAMSAFYLKGVAPPHVTLNQIFAGMMPYMLVVIFCMALMYLWPGMSLWLPEFLYGR
jgi:TRAP-type mannitol/chloroaromatic compound transport system permease large subunit